MALVLLWPILCLGLHCGGFTVGFTDFIMTQGHRLSWQVAWDSHTVTTRLLRQTTIAKTRLNRIAHALLIAEKIYARKMHQTRATQIY